MYKYEEKDWLSLVDALSLLEKLTIAPPSVQTDTNPTPKKSVAPVDPVNPSYYPQPDVFTYAKAHGLDPIEFSVVKYVTRWRKKDGVTDLKKARNCIDKLIADAEKKPLVPKSMTL